MKNYRKSVRLPQTNFPMRANLTQKEPGILSHWQKEKLYEQIQEARKDSPLFLLHDGPPFANGHVHMGTALNKCLKDFIIKSKTMAGFRAPYIPGWDCHGLPIEFKVIQAAQKQEEKPLSALTIRQRSEKYARGFIKTQKEEFCRLGVFGDWQNPYLTLNPSYEATIIRSFGKMVTQGMIYRKKKPVYWSTPARTALAEAEVEYREKISPAAYVAFPLTTFGPDLEKLLSSCQSISFSTCQNAAAVIWTTTPWTLPSNAAIAFHPEANYVLLETIAPTEDSSEPSPRYQYYLIAEALQEKFLEATQPQLSKVVASFSGKTLEGSITTHPFIDRPSPLLPADFVTMESGTGLVHIAPGHGDDDYHLGTRFNLPILSPIDDGGYFTEEVALPKLVGKNTDEANRLILELLEQKKLLLAHHPHHHSYPHCWRSKTPILFRAVEQFFISVDQLRKKALETIDTVNWIPGWGHTRMQATVENRPDWCISRQRYWGVPLPAFYDPQGEVILDPELIEKVASIIEKEGSDAWFALDDAAWCERIGAPTGSSRRHDILDVWIESGISHEAVLGQRPELSFPADLYLEATDQHRGWFQSSLMTSIALHEKAPYRSVFTHGFVVDSDTRQKISKSAQGEKGGYQKPTEAIHFMNHYGADIVRLWASSIQATDEVPFSEEIFARLTDSYRRIRNSLRILLANIGEKRPPLDSDLTSFLATLPKQSIDAWILYRFNELTKNCRRAYEEFSFQKVYQLLINFCTVDLSSHYIDVTKDRLYCDGVDSLRRQQTETTMAWLFEGLVRLLAPILPFTAEEAWGHYRETFTDSNTLPASVHLTFFPEVIPPNQELLAYYESLLELKGAIAQELELAQQAGIIANPLEASVKIFTTNPLLLAKGESDEKNLDQEHSLEEFCILSHLELHHLQELSPEDRKSLKDQQDQDSLKIIITRYRAQKCERCWRHRPEVGSYLDHPSLCKRCYDVINS